MAISKAELESAGSKFTPVTGVNSPTRETPSIDPQTAQQIHDAIIDRDVNRSYEVLDKLRGILPEDQARLAAYGSDRSDEVLYFPESNRAEEHTIVDFSSDQKQYLPPMDYQT